MELLQLYDDPNVVARLMELFTEAASCLGRVRCGDREVIKAVRAEKERRRITRRDYLALVSIPNAEVKLHKLLQKVMVDLADPEPGSIHELVNRHFLPSGHVFVHDAAKGCFVAIT
jgi:hypothetical protein